MQNESDEDDNKMPMTQQTLIEKIQKKKEAIGKLRCQAWDMRRKRKTLR